MLHARGRLAECQHPWGPAARASSQACQVIPFTFFLCSCCAEGSLAALDLFSQQRKVQRKKKRSSRMGKTEVKAARRTPSLSGRQSYIAPEGTLPLFCFCFSSCCPAPQSFQTLTVPSARFSQLTVKEVVASGDQQKPRFLIL